MFGKLIFLARSSLTSSHLPSLFDQYFKILSKCTKPTSKSSSLVFLFLWLTSICYYLPFIPQSPHVIEEILIFLINPLAANSKGCASINAKTPHQPQLIWLLCCPGLLPWWLRTKINMFLWITRLTFANTRIKIWGCFIYIFILWKPCKFPMAIISVRLRKVIPTIRVKFSKLSFL